ncbi:hypothetical protein JW887_01685 [Candidatus Dojkabacteria bacterium]|nr:hypothetical protein [Candidatus Dojkabacteria bacterium]
MNKAGQISDGQKGRFRMSSILGLIVSLGIGFVSTSVFFGLYVYSIYNYSENKMGYFIAGLTVFFGSLIVGVVMFISLISISNSTEVKVATGKPRFEQKSVQLGRSYMHLNFMVIDNVDFIYLPFYNDIFVADKTYSIYYIARANNNNQILSVEELD